MRKLGLKRLDHYAIFMENNSRYLEACGAGERSGLYFTCVNSYLTPGELAYIVNNSESRVLITSVAKLDVAREALKECPKVELCIVVDGAGESERIVGLQEATRGLPKTPIADECIGTAMLYSSGTTGRPKGILRPLPEQPPAQQLPIFDFLQKLWQYREGMIYLSPAPLYHSAPQAAVNLTIRDGRHRHHHGAFRSRALPRAGREMGRHPQPAGADDVLAHAEAAGGRCESATTCRRSRSRSTPRRPARPR